MSLTQVACCTQYEIKPDSPTCYTEYMPGHLQNRQPELFQITRMNPLMTCSNKFIS